MHAYWRACDEVRLNYIHIILKIGYHENINMKDEIEILKDTQTNKSEKMKKYDIIGSAAVRDQNLS